MHQLTDALNWDLASPDNSQWAGASKLWKKLHNSAKHLRMEVVEGLLEAHRQGESDDIKMSKIYAKSGIWG